MGYIMRTVEEKNTLLQDIIEESKQKGATDVDVFLYEGIALSTTTRWKKLESLERSEQAELGIRFFSGQKQALVSTTDFSKKSLSNLIARAADMSKAIPEDQYIGLTADSEIVTAYPELSIYDPAEPSEEELMERARVAEETALEVKGITNTEGGSAGWQKVSVAMAASNGFVGHYDRSSHSVSAVVVAGEGTQMERDYAYHTTNFVKDLMSPEKIGKEAAEKTLKRLNPRKISSTKAPIIFEPKLSNNILSYLASSINGAAIARGTSFLRESMGQRILPENISICDDPHLEKGQRSKPFDSEGRANQKRMFVENGVLQSWFLDNRSARQLGLSSTGHAARGVSSPPSPSPTNLYMQAGDVTPQNLIGSIKKGLLVTEVIGSGFNGVTGDYSQGASGFWIENGEILYPVNEVTIAGNMKDMFLNIVAANDLEFRYGFNAPTICIENMTIAGK